MSSEMSLSSGKPSCFCLSEVLPQERVDKEGVQELESQLDELNGQFHSDDPEWKLTFSEIESKIRCLAETMWFLFCFRLAHISTIKISRV